MFSKPSFELLLQYVHYICHIDFVHRLAPTLFDVINDVFEKTKSKYENPVAPQVSFHFFFFFFFFFFFSGDNFVLVL